VRRGKLILSVLALTQQLLALLLLLLPAPASAAPPPFYPAPPWYDDSIPPGYIALWRGGARTLMPFYGWVPSGYDFWVVRAVTSLPKLSATVSVDPSRDAVLTPWIYDAAFSWSGGGVPAYALPVSLNQGWNLVFLRKSSQPSASGMWAYVTAQDWSQVRFGDATGLPSGFLTYSIIWSNSTHAQVLVYAPQPGTYYLYWQSQVQVPYANVTNPLPTCASGDCYLYFNGVNNYARVPRSTSLTLSGNFTVCARLAPTKKYAWWSGIVDNGRNYVANWWILARMNHAGFVAGVALSDGSILEAYFPNETLFTFHSYCFGVSGSTLFAYRDGSLFSSKSFSGTRNVRTLPIDIGRRNWGGDYEQAMVSYVLVYNRSLTASEISAIHSDPSKPPSDSLVLWLRADPRYIYDGNWDGYVDWIDLSGNGNHGTLYNFHSQGRFTGAVYAVSAFFPPLSQPSFTVTYRPGGGRLTVSWVPFGAQLTVRDSSGNVVYSGVGQGLPITLGLPAGTYAVELSAAGSALTGVSAQPFYALRSQVSLSSGSGATVAPHLYSWYFGGGYLYAENSASLNLTGAFTLTTAVRNLFTAGTTVATKRQSTLSSPPACAQYDAYGIKVDSQGRAQAVMTSSAGATYAAADSANLGDLSNGRLVWLAARYDGSSLRIYRNGTATSTSAGGVALLTCPTRFTLAWDAAGNNAYGYVSYVALHAAAVDPSQVATSFQVPASNLVLFSDPTFWDGSKYVDLSGWGNHLYPVGSVSRVEAASKWLWVVQGLGPAGAVTFRFVPAGAFVRVLDPSGNPVYQFASDGGDVTVSLPDGTYAVEVWLPAGGGAPAPVRVSAWGDEVYGVGSGLLAASLAQQPTPGGEVGWMAGRLYRVRILLQGSAAGSLSSYLVPVALWRGGAPSGYGNAVPCPKCAPDFSDVAFAGCDGRTVLPAWREYSDPQKAVFWVQVPAIPAYPATSAIYVYYGLAPSASGGGAVPWPQAPLIEGFEGYAEGAVVPSRGTGSARVVSVPGGKALLLSSQGPAATAIASAGASGGRLIARIWFNVSGSVFLGWCDGSTFTAAGVPSRSLLVILNSTVIQIRQNLGPPLASSPASIPAMSWLRVEVRWWAGAAHALVSQDPTSPPIAQVHTYASQPDAGLTYLAIGVNGTGSVFIDYVALLPGVIPDAYPVAGEEEVMSAVPLPAAPPPASLPAAAPPIDPVPALSAALGDPLRGALLSTAFVAAMVIAASKLELSLPLAAALAGAVVLMIGVHAGNAGLVGAGAVALAVAAVLAFTRGG
jgi:hypothetical protein